MGSGSVQGILGALYVDDPPGYTTLNINDLYDNASRLATLSTFSNGPDAGPWGSITGLAPAAINFAWNDVYSPVNISTPLDSYRYAPNVTWNVDSDALSSVVGIVVLDNGNQIN